MEDRLYTRTEVMQMRGNAFLNGIDYGMQIQKDYQKDMICIPREAFDEIMKANRVTLENNTPCHD